MSLPMGQSRRWSLVEAAINVLVGFLVALATQLAVFPLFGLSVSLGENLSISGIFTVVSIVRSYCLRRAFNWWHLRAWKERKKP